MGRFTNPRDLYFGEGARHEVKNFKGHKAMIVSGGTWRSSCSRASSPTPPLRPS